MAKYLIKVTLTQAGAKGTMAEGGSKRREAVDELFRSVGGHVEAFYYGFGEDDVYGIVDVPDNVSAAAASLLVSSAGTGHIATIPLLTPEEMDEVARKGGTYRPPGA
jgi:uncharacterized protein with GYD domain